jgi:hypothetical protein
MIVHGYSGARRWGRQCSEQRVCDSLTLWMAFAKSVFDEPDEGFLNAVSLK